MTTMLDASERWDRRYLEGDGHPYGEDPDPLVAEVAGTLAPGDALDLGAGDGRNALWLLHHGWRVTAVDFSSIALAELVGASWGEHHDLVAIRADLRTWRPHPDSADLVLLSYIPLPATDRPGFYRAAAAALRPGGRLLLLSGTTGGADAPDEVVPLPTVDEVTRDLEGLTIERAAVTHRTVGGHPSDDVVVLARHG